MEMCLNSEAQFANVVPLHFTAFQIPSMHCSPVPTLASCNVLSIIL